MDITEQILDTWRIHNRITLYLLDAIPEEALADAPGTKGRTVGEQLAHLHNVRLMWFKVSTPKILERYEKIEKEDAGRKDLLRSAIEASGAGVEDLLREAFAAGGKIKGFKPHATAFLGYLIAHEAHHRGQILLALKACGHKIDQKTQYGLWEWGVR